MASGCQPPFGIPATLAALRCDISAIRFVISIPPNLLGFVIMFQSYDYFSLLRVLFQHTGEPRQSVLNQFYHLYLIIKSTSPGSSVTREQEKLARQVPLENL